MSSFSTWSDTGASDVLGGQYELREKNTFLEIYARQHDPTGRIRSISCCAKIRSPKSSSGTCSTRGDTETLTMTGSTTPSGHSERSDRALDDHAGLNLGEYDGAELAELPSHPEETAQLLRKVYDTYLAVPRNSGRTLMWRGLPRRWNEADLLDALAAMDCAVHAEYFYLPPMPWPKLSRKRDRSSPRAQKNHGYAFVHFATDCGADLFQRRVADFAAGFLGPLLGENVAEMWASVAVLQGLTNNLVNLTATSQGRKARRRTDRMDTCVVLRLDGQFVEIPKVALMKLQLR